MNRTELEQLIKGYVDKAVEGFELPEGVNFQDHVKGLVDEFLPQIPANVDPKDVRPGDHVPQVSETPILDQVRLQIAKAGKFQDPETNERIIKEYREKDFVVGTTTAGGHTAPSEYSRQLFDTIYKDSNVAGYLRRIVLPRGPAIVFPVVTSGTTAYTVAESSDSGTSTATTESTATYTTKTLTVYRHGVYSKVSNELMEDADPSIEAWVRMDMARQLASYFDWAVFHGAGSAGADGTNSLITGLGVGAGLITSNIKSASGGLSFDNIVDLRVPGDNTPGPLTLFMNPAAERELMKLKGTDGQYIYHPAVREDGVGMIWGMPVVLNNRISKALGGGNETSIFSGAFGTSGLMGVKSGINLIVDPFTHAEYFSTRIIAHIRLGFQVVDESHFAVLNGIDLS